MFALPSSPAKAIPSSLLPVAVGPTMARMGGMAEIGYLELAESEPPASSSPARWPLITPALFSHRTPPDREKRERFAERLLSPSLPVGGSAVGERGWGVRGRPEGAVLPSFRRPRHLDPQPPVPPEPHHDLPGPVGPQHPGPVTLEPLDDLGRGVGIAVPASHRDQGEPRLDGVQEVFGRGGPAAVVGDLEEVGPQGPGAAVD